MLAVDTNVIVRFLTRDDAEQFARASALIRDDGVYVCTTVLLVTFDQRFAAVASSLSEVKVRPP